MASFSDPCGASLLGVQFNVSYFAAFYGREGALTHLAWIARCLPGLHCSLDSRSSSLYQCGRDLWQGFAVLVDVVAIVQSGSATLLVQLLMPRYPHNATER